MCEISFLLFLFHARIRSAIVQNQNVDPAEWQPHVLLVVFPEANVFFLSRLLITAPSVMATTLWVRSISFPGSTPVCSSKWRILFFLGQTWALIITSRSFWKSHLFFFRTNVCRYLPTFHLASPK